MSPAFMYKAVVFLLIALIFSACGNGGTGNEIIATHTVSYDGNGNTSGSVPTDSTNYEQGNTVTVPGNTGIVARDHYTFAGWGVNSNGIGNSYTQGQTFVMGSANVTLYAKWTQNPTYTITYDGNGNTSGSVPTDSTNYEEGNTVTIFGNAGNLARDHYMFAGWCVNSNGTGDSYTQGQTFIMGSTNVTLYAKWTPNSTYMVTYDGNGNTSGSVPTDSTNYEQGNTVTVLGNAGNLVRDHYTFAGWGVNSNGIGNSYTQGQTFVMGSANVTLYAKWTQNPTYTITYDGNGNTSGSAPTDSTNYEEGNTVTVLGNAGNLARDHYMFAGWCVNSNGTGDSYTQGQTFIMGSTNVTLYAKWTPNPTYMVTYDGNGNTSGSVPTDSTNYEQGNTVTVLGNAGNLARDHYMFAGWCVNSNGIGNSYTQGQTFIMGSTNVTLYAKWTPNPTYMVTYDGNGNTSGNAPTDSTNYEEGATVTVFGNTGNLTIACDTFSGWNTQADGNGTDRTPSSTFAMSTANVILYAKWTVNPISTWYRDLDGDGYGVLSISIQSCTRPVGYVAVSGDCNDADSAIHPGAYDIPGDSIDQDCNTVAN